MIKLLKGDDSRHTVEISLPQAAFSPGMQIEFTAGDYKATFAAQERVTLDFPAAWTSRQSPGRLLGRWTLISPAGERATILSAYPLYITIDGTDISSGGSVSTVMPTVDLTGLSELDASASPGDTKDLLNELLRRLRSACIALAIGVPALVSVAATAHKSPLDEVHGTDGVVTNVSFEGLATTADLDDKRDKADLKVYGEAEPVLLPECLPVKDRYGQTVEPIVKYYDIDGDVLNLSIDGRVSIMFNIKSGCAIYCGEENATFGGKPCMTGEWPIFTFLRKQVDTLATSGEIGEVTGYARAVYNYMLGNTNAWFSGTNYPDHTSVAVKHKFEFEPGMDLAAVPCSMALWEIRDGKRGVVWDQRDWVSWYWSFKASQMRCEIAATNAAIMAAIPRKAWGTYTASGLENPDPSTVWVDAASTTLAAGFAWQTVANVSGCAYWTIVGNGAVIGNSGTNAVLEIRDFEGKAVMRIVKGENYLAYVDSSSMTGQGHDAQGRVTFDLTANVQPVGEYSTVLETSSFVEESSSGCPVDYEWENLGDGRWRIHFILKPGINSNACFARFKVAVQRDSTIEYTTAPTISGGLVYKGIKIAPVIPPDAEVGDIVPWKVVVK